MGKGAKWTATQVIEQRTARIQQISTFELLDLKGKRVRATSRYAAEAPKQDIKMPGSKSAPFKLDKLELRGGGKGTWRLNQLGPSSATEQVFSGFIMTATAPKREIVIMGVDTTTCGTAASSARARRHA